MAKRKLTERQTLQRDAAREMTVAKRDDMVQKGRHQLSVREQRCVLYAISKIKPEDTAFQEYTFSLSDFYTLCGLADESYTELKGILKGLRDRSWTAVTDDKGTESTVSWFNKVRTNKREGRVTIRFDDDMMPYLLQLTKQNAFYTSYNLQYVLPMSSQFSPRLYELLKSYQKNNREWFFPTEELQRLLNAENYSKNFNDFRKRVLDPAIEEINQYTDLNIAMDVVREGRGGRVVRVIFYMAEKSDDALLDAKRAIRDKLDGQLTIEDILAQLPDEEESVKAKFMRENPPKRKKRPSEGF